MVDRSSTASTPSPFTSTLAVLNYPFLISTSSTTLTTYQTCLLKKGSEGQLSEPNDPLHTQRFQDANQSVFSIIRFQYHRLSPRNPCSSTAMNARHGMTQSSDSVRMMERGEPADGSRNNNEEETLKLQGQNIQAWTLPRKGRRAYIN